MERTWKLLLERFRVLRFGLRGIEGYIGVFRNNEESHEAENAK